ncbi:STAS domain-containing protein [Virgibacillus sediminis]|uniref:STAS domain-containing protein n=1 Tax=Virgibacillus sediminis TaxID=202260 RepID=A0ABV7A3M4_9BACI
MIDQEVKRVGERFEAVLSDLLDRYPGSFFEPQEIKENVLECLNLFAEALQERERLFDDRTLEYGKKTGEMALRHGKHLDDSITQLAAAKRETWQQLKEIMLDLGVSVETALQIADIFDPIFDQVISSFTRAYIKSYDESIKHAEDEFLRLSAPVITIFDEVAVLPIIGGINEKRAELLMKTALDEAGKKNLSHLFIDLSGVKLVDTMVAYNIYKIIQSLELVGVETVIAGIRPEVSQTMVSLGVDFSTIRTYSSLKQALDRHMHISVQK